jgi:hypothetical protein
MQVISWSHVTPCSVDGFELRYGSSPNALDQVIDVGLPRQAGGHFSYELEVQDDEELSVCVAAMRGSEVSECSNQLSIAPSFEDDLRSEHAPDETEPGESPWQWCEDFTGGKQRDWISTGPQNGLAATPNLFTVTEIGAASQALVTNSWADDIHSHFLGSNDEGAPSALWSGYEYSGQMAFFDPEGGVGVTIYSRYNLASDYYRLGLDPLTGSFRLIRSQMDPSYDCDDLGTPDSGASPNQWYAFRLRAADDGVKTTLEAKVWPADRREPEGFQWICTDVRQNRQLSGAVGVWASGPGAKAWDSLHAAKLAAPSETDALGTPGKPRLVR